MIRIIKACLQFILFVAMSGLLFIASTAGLLIACFLYVTSSIVSIRLGVLIPDTHILKTQ
jgi:hypothetical protein